MLDKIKNVMFVLGIIDSLIDAMKALEKHFPKTGEGQTRLEVIKQVVMGVTGDTGLWDIIEKVVNGLVGFFNKNGTFTK